MLLEALLLAQIQLNSSLWTEQLTAPEIEARVRAGATTVIIGTGGTEPNGPYTVTGKHNYIVEMVLPLVARELGNTLLAPVVKFVPETSHVGKPGTIHLSEATFVALLKDIARSYAAQGFREVILVGDSGGNQAGMQRAASELNREWKGKPQLARYIAEFYTEDPWSYQFLKSRGIVQIDNAAPAGQPKDRPAAVRNGIHDDVYYEAQLAAIDPELIRASAREKSGELKLHGVNLAPITRTAQLGRDLAAYRAGIVVKAIRKARGR